MTRWGQVTEWLRLVNPRVGVEVGVKEGRFISYLLDEYPDLLMYAVDPWEDQPNGSETYKEWDWNAIFNDYKNRIAKYQDRVITLKLYSIHAAKIIKDESLDFVFIDAQHDYVSVKQDIELWKPKIKPNGLLCGHDYQPKFPGVMRAVDEMFDKPALGSNDTWAIII